MRKCVFFDRDGIVNEPPEPGGYVQRVDDFHTQPAFLGALRIVTQLGYDVVVVTNQQGVGKGLYSEETLAAIHAKLKQDVSAVGLEILAIYHCPHLANENCECRKPKPGMLRQAARDWNIDLEASWLVGDSLRDIDAGAAAGCRTVLVNPLSDEKATVSIGLIDELPETMKDVLSEAGRE